ncbi:MAG: efflux RND transporter periplasmic adaptor subunit [Planctomycetes bacterium]|nr:efflux RND transporter periplasmic adaptor subunit [Planctomycetota bacterium]
MPHRSLLPLVLLVLASCAPTEAGPAQSGPPPAPQVGVAPVEVRALADTIELTGRIAAVESVEVRPRVSGYLEAPKFEAGATVEKGQILFQIDPRWNQAVVDQRKAELESAQVRLSNAESENERAAKLLQTRAISAEEAESRAARLREARAALAAARAADESAALDLEYTTIRSPIHGVISRAQVTEGNFVSGIPAANTLLATIVSTDPLYLYADIDEASFLRLQHMRSTHGGPDHSVEIEVGLSGEEDFPRKARLESLDNQIDPGTGTMTLRALLDNKDGTLVPGLFARLRLPLDASEPALLVDERAIGTDQNQKFVLVLGEGDKAEYRKVVLGPRVGELRVIREGLKPEDRVIVTGLQRVRPGAPVVAGPVAAETP